MENKKVLGIGIDGVLRDLHSQFDKWYRRTYIKNESLVQMDENFHYVPDGEKNEDDENIIIKRVEDLITLPIDTADLMNHYYFETREDFELFLHQDYVFQIFGSANEFLRTTDYANLIQSFGEVNKLYDTILLSKENDKSVSATYHFLAKHVCKIKNIKFVDANEDKWKYCDVLIDSEPEIFETKPEGKMSIKISHEYNAWSESDYSFDSIVNVYNQELLLKLFNKK